MRRRLDVAASLLAAPPVLFLDEPTTGLDPRGRLALWQVLGGLTAQGTSLLLTTQYIEEAERLAGMVVIIDHGKVIAAAPPASSGPGPGGPAGPAVPARRATRASWQPRWRALGTGGAVAGRRRERARVVLPVADGPADPIPPWPHAVAQPARTARSPR